MLNQLFTSVSVNIVDIYLHFGEYLFITALNHPCNDTGLCDVEVCTRPNNAVISFSNSLKTVFNHI